ncbi:MAG: hypothetical protein WDA09_06380, partial [Bacteriovoracaceae bacterium]
MLLIIDGNNQVYVSSTAQKLSSKKGFPTQAVYGTLESLMHYLERFRPVDSLVFVFDGGHSKKRLALHPEYKKRDNKDEEVVKEFQLQLPVVKEMLRCLSIDTIEITGVEADDIIA